VAIAEAILNNTAISVSDGSYKKQQDTAAFVLAYPSQAELDALSRIVGCHVAPGYDSDQSQYAS
jgi:hypothetical protein